MKRILETLSVSFLIIFSITTYADHEQSHGHSVARGHARPGGAPVFPKYPNQRPQGHSAIQPVRKVPFHADSLGNRVTDDHLSRVEFAHGRAEGVMKNNPHVTDVVRVGRARYVNVYRPEFDKRRVFIDAGLVHYNAIIVQHPREINWWHRHFFYGGFYYGFHPVVDIDTYFYNPMVYWFYAPRFDRDYYHSWYNTQYEAYPQLQHAFAYHGLFYPTENLRQLLFGVSAMPVEKQVNFRVAIEQFTKKVAQNLADALALHVKLANGDIVVTHYEVLGYDEAVVLEGFVTLNGTQYNFKGLLDLQVPLNTAVFAPVSLDKDPTTAQIKNLNSVNTKISEIKGEPAEPVSPADNGADGAGTNQTPDQTSGEVTADPVKN